MSWWLWNYEGKEVEFQILGFTCSIGEDRISEFFVAYSLGKDGIS